MTQRVLAAADSYRGSVEPRPHRAALDPAVRRTAAMARRRRVVSTGRPWTPYSPRPGTAPGAGPSGPAGLTAREVEVLGLVARGCSTDEVARRLVISTKTVGHHLEHIYLKAGVQPGGCSPLRRRARAPLRGRRWGKHPMTRAPGRHDREISRHSEGAHHEDQVRDRLATGLEDAEKVTVAFLVSVGSAEAGRPTLMFLTKEATRLVGRADIRPRLACEACPPLEDLVRRYADAGGRYLVCPICFDARATWTKGEPARNRRARRHRSRCGSGSAMKPPTPSATERTDLPGGAAGPGHRRSGRRTAVLALLHAGRLSCGHPAPVLGRRDPDGGRRHRLGVWFDPAKTVTGLSVARDRHRG